MIAFIHFRERFFDFTHRLFDGLVEKLGFPFRKRGQYIIDDIVRVLGSTDSHANAEKLVGSQSFGDRPNSFLTGIATLSFHLDLAQRQVYVVMNHKNLFGQNLQSGNKRLDRLPTVVHIGHWLGNHDLTAPYFSFTIESLVLVPGELNPVFLCQIIGNKKTDVMTRQLVTRAGIAQANN